MNPSPSWRLRIPLALVLLSTLWSAGLAAGDSSHANLQEAWRWVEFTSASGLPSDHVIQVLESPGGTIWAVTSRGLAWYDGFRWIAIDSSRGLPPAQTMGLLGTTGEELVLRIVDFYRGGKEGFHHLDLPEISSVLPFDDGSMLVVRRGSVFRLANDALQPFGPPQPELNGTVVSLLRTAAGSIWLSATTGLYRWEGGRWKPKLGSGVNILGKNFLAENAGGEGVISVQFPFGMRGLWEWNRGEEIHRHESEQMDDIKAIDIGPDGDVVMVSQSDDVRLRHNGVWSDVPLASSQIRDIVTVKFRPNGDLWVGTEHGLFLCNRSSSRWSSWRHGNPDFRNSVNEIFQDRDSIIWVGTSNGVELHDPGGRVSDITEIQGKPLYVVTGISQDADGNVWVSSGSSFAGAYRWNGSRWDHFDVGGSDVYIHKIRKDRQGRLWFLGIGVHAGLGSTGEPGAFVLEDGRFIHWGTERGLLSGRVYAFAEGREGSLWFGTMAGISRWTPSGTASEGTWTHWTNREGLRGHRVFTLAVDSSDIVWFGDYDGRQGLGYVDAHDSIHYLTTADGLVNDQIWDLKTDHRGILWITTSGGLSSLDNGVFSSFDEKSGLPHLSLWPVLPLDRHVYVGTTGRGVAILDRSESVTPTPIVDLEAPLIEHNNVLLRWKALAYRGELSPHDILTRYRLAGRPWSPWARLTEVTLTDLPAGDYTYQVQAKGLFGNFDVGGSRGAFTVPLPFHLRPLFVIPVGLLTLVIVLLSVIILLRKRKHGMDVRRSEEKFRTVAEMTSSAILIYLEDRLVFVNAGATNLTGYSEKELLAMHLLQLVHPDHQQRVRERELTRQGNTSVPQRYECKIVAKSGDERWIDFSSGWIKFQGLPVRLGTAMDITDRKKAEDKLRSLASELSLTEERERRRMASYLHDVIGQTLALCKIKIRALQKSPPANGLEATLLDLRNLIEQSIHNTQSLTFELCPPILYELSLEAAVEWLGERMHEQSGLAIVVEDDKQAKPLSNDMRAVLFQAVREILVNIVKHAQATRVNIRLGRSDGRFHIIIRDNGVGFEISRRGETKTGGGFGLFNIRERLSYLGGQLDIESQPGAGTNVTINVPLSTDLQLTSVP